MVDRELREEAIKTFGANFSLSLSLGSQLHIYFFKYDMLGRVDMITAVFESEMLHYTRV
jgi:hypothetical protein